MVNKTKNKVIVGYCTICNADRSMIPIKINGVRLWRCLTCRSMFSSDLLFRVELNMPRVDGGSDK